MESDCGSAFDSEKPWALWREAFGGNSQRPEYSRVISPYRGEEFESTTSTGPSRIGAREAGGGVASHRRHRPLRQGDPEEKSPAQTESGPTTHQRRPASRSRSTTATSASRSRTATTPASSAGQGSDRNASKSSSLISPTTRSATEASSGKRPLGSGCRLRASKRTCKARVRRLGAQGTGE